MHQAAFIFLLFFIEFACIFLDKLFYWLLLHHWCNEQHDIIMLPSFEKQFFLIFFKKSLASHGVYLYKMGIINNINKKGSL